MTTGDLTRVKEVFLAALACPPDERERFVEDVCGSHSQVRDEVLRLVRIRREWANQAVRPTESWRPAPPVPSGDPPRAGDRVLSRYVLGDPIGAGAFGTVHRGTDAVTRAPVAVKVTALRTGRAAQWHRWEVATLLRFNVPGVVRLLATGRCGEFAVLVMDLVEGSPFPGDGIGPNDVREILVRAASLLEAVGRLHAVGVYHRDLKPSNVLVDRQGRVTLVDLGIAEDESDYVRRNGGVLAGTPSFMAPELLRGAPADRRTELYAIGIILIHALTGEIPDGARPAHPRTNPFSAYPEGVEERLSRLAGGPVRDLLASLINEDPERRPRDVEEGLARLEGVLGIRHELELPRLGDRQPLEAVLAAARAGRSVDVAGPRGSGRTRLLADVERTLAAEGRLVRWVRPVRLADSAPFPADPMEIEAEDRARCRRIRREVEEGLVLLVDDAEALDPGTRDLMEELRPAGAVIRAFGGGDAVADAVRLAPLATDDLLPIVEGPERLFHLPAETSELLHARSRGSPRELVREIRSWCRVGLAEWKGRLAVSPSSLPRLKSMGPMPAAREEVPEDLPDGARETWDALTLLAAPVAVEELARILERPERMVASELRVLAEAGFAVDGGDVADLVAGSPFLADRGGAVRARWSERAAGLPLSRARRDLRRPTSGEDLATASVEVLETARRSVEEGRTADAAAALDRALVSARQHLSSRSDLYGDLLGAMSEAALSIATPAAVALARYHVNLAPARTERVEAWDVVLQAAAALLNGDGAGALRTLNESPRLPTEAHERAAHIVACFAARTTGDPEQAKARVGNAVSWVRRVRTPEARALLAGWTGWLRFDQGRFAAASRLHGRAARLTRRRRARTTSLVNAAMAALESLDLAAATAAAEGALRASRASGDGVNEARAELLLRQAAYRSGTTTDLDEELLAAAAEMGDLGVRGALRLNEASVAWRSRRLQRASELASSAALDLGAAGFAAAAALASGLASRCGRPLPPDAVDRVWDAARARRPIGLVAQALALMDAAPPDPAAEEAWAAAVDWASTAPGPDVRREVLTPRETLARLEDRRPALASRKEA